MSFSLFCYVYNSEHFQSATKPSTDPTHHDLPPSMICLVFRFPTTIILVKRTLLVPLISRNVAELLQPEAYHLDHMLLLQPID